jgi:hypothetical protein
MTRRDYVLLSGAINKAVTAIRETHTPETDEAMVGAQFIAETIGDALAQVNGRFDRARFMRDAGFAS